MKIVARGRVKRDTQGSPKGLWPIMEILCDECGQPVYVRPPGTPAPEPPGGFLSNAVVVYDPAEVYSSPSEPSEVFVLHKGKCDKDFCEGRHLSVSEELHAFLFNIGTDLGLPIYDALYQAQVVVEGSKPYGQFKSRVDSSEIALMKQKLDAIGLNTD